MNYFIVKIEENYYLEQLHDGEVVDFRKIDMEMLLRMFRIAHEIKKEVEESEEGAY